MSIQMIFMMMRKFDKTIYMSIHSLKIQIMKAANKKNRNNLLHKIKDRIKSNINKIIILINLRYKRIILSNNITNKKRKY